MTRRETIASLSALKDYLEKPGLSDRAARALVSAQLSGLIYRLSKPRDRTARLGASVANAMRRIVNRAAKGAPGQ